MVEDTLTGDDGLIVDRLGHGRGQGKGQLVRLSEAEGNGQQSLRV